MITRELVTNLKKSISLLKMPVIPVKKPGPATRTGVSWFLVSCLFLFGFYPSGSDAQTNPNEAQWSGNGYSIKKVVSNTTIASGVNFSYTIIFSAPTGVSNVSIQDIVPIPPLTILSVTAAGPVLGVTPVTTFNNTTGVVTYNLTSLPATGPPSGSFTIVVKFPEGITCNGAAARNRVGIMVNGQWQWTEYVSTIATAVDPWIVTKSIISGAVVDPMGGTCGYLMKPGDTITYRLSVMKASPYWGNVIGQQNVTSAVVKDLLPLGATMLPNPNASFSSSTITWNVNPTSFVLDAANPWAYYWVDVKVVYPAVSFPVSTQILNSATLSGISCLQQITHISNQTCIKVANIQPNPSAFFGKYLAMTNRVPGCSGYYYIVFCNNGNVPLTAFNINDAIPSGISVNQVQIYNASATTTMNLNVNSTPFATGISSGSYSSGAITSTVTNLQFQMTGTMPVGACLYMYVYFTINPNPTGTVVTNCATFAPLANALTLPQACVSFTVDAGAPLPCLIKDICSPKTSYDPGDIVRFRLRVQNIGSASLSGAAIQDVLNTSFTYVGNETYYQSSNYNPPCSTGGTPPAGATAWSGVTPLHSGNNLSWNLPVIPSNCQLFYTAACGYYGTWGIPYYYIEFDAKVDSFALPGVTPNFYKVSGGNLSAPVTSNTVNVLIVASFGQEVNKLLSTDNGANYAASGTATPGSTARFRLNYKNVSNVGISSIRLVDLLALDDTPNDWLIFNRSVSRGSQFDISYIGNPATSLLPVAAPPVATISWATGENICLPPYVASGCTTTSWGSTPASNVRMDFGTFVLGPNKYLREDFDIGIPNSAKMPQKVCNDFAAIASANFLLNGSPQVVVLTPVAAPPVCLTIDSTHVSCCDSVKVVRAPGANGVIGCCAKITTTCKVKSIDVTVTNGTLSSTSWNCTTPVPPGYVGQSSFTFAPNGCIVSMVNCVNPKLTGVVTIAYTVNFENGETCKKEIKLDCSIVVPTCCDSVKVEAIPDPTGTRCCAKLTTTCKVKAVDVSITNGTFSSTGWNCSTPVPTGYVGQSSFTFAPNGCVLTMTNCVNLKQTGTVVISYVIYFDNGEQCKKEIKFDCQGPVTTCCDSVRVVPVVNAAGVKECCARITTTCKVKAVDVTVTNGSLSSTSWNCGTLPSGYVGASTFTFAPNGCVLDMTNCVTPKQTGVVVISYVIYFENGEKCEKKIELDCAVVSCCDSVKIEKVVNSDGTASCCAKLTTTCEVKSIDVAVTNGTLSSVSWNCTTPVPTGYVGLSTFTFAPGTCIPKMITCVSPKATGIVILTYDIVFANGEKCHKVLDLNCAVVTPTCCDSVKVEAVIFPTANKCCVKLTTTCKVKAVDVTITNGTFNSTSWNCTTPVPTGYVGQSSYTFAPNGCVLQMINCVNPKQTGSVVISYIIYFENGEKCQKEIKLDCTPTPASCCDSIRVVPVVNAAGVKECCARITTTCKVKAVDVTVTNGTLSTASWNCGTLPSGYVGASTFTFAPNGCVLDMTNCVTPKQTGVVVISYVIYFENGEKCEKKIELDCAVVSCCDSVKIEKVVNSDGTASCCVKLTTTCEVKSIDVAVTNGTLSSASWNCTTPVPTGYVGLSTFTFAPGTCIPKMITCVSPKATGIVILTYDIVFANGEKCHKVLDLDCAVVPHTCCDSVKVEAVIFPTANKCCAKLTTTCKVKAVDVTITNGTFNSTSWNCTTPVPAGYVGQSSYTFAPNGCVLQMINCVNPKQTGSVVISYIIYFENGEKCQKEIKLDCTPTPASCCDSIRVVPVVNAAGVKECCARITTTCKVKAVDVTVTNGTLSTAIWNCGTLPSGYVGASTFTFAPNGCVLDMTNCVSPKQTGVVVISYVVYFENGEKCEKKIELDCNVLTCCDKVKVTAIDGDGCCARIVSECQIRTMDVTITNGVINSAAWNCGTIPAGYVGQSSYTFVPGNCLMDLKLCIKPLQNGSVVINYSITFANGEKCEKSIKLNCSVYSSCCALIDFKLKTKWPNFKTQIGSFHVTNIDPTVPICYIEITPSPAATFATGGLVIDGVSSGLTWNSTRIPASGNLTPTAINTMDFNLTATSYKGIIKICVVKCDGTRCCFEFKWNNSILSDVVVDIDKGQNKTGLVAVSISPVVKTAITNKIKTVVFGLTDEKEVADSIPEFWAISASPQNGEDYPLKLASTINAYMGKHYAFFELATAKSATEYLGLFNLAFTKKLPKLGCTLIDENGNIIYSGTINVSGSDTVTSSLTIDAFGTQGNMFEFINLYPNPSDGSFRITYATGTPRDVEIKVITSTGQIVYNQLSPDRMAGIHNVNVEANLLSSGLYKVILYSDGENVSKSLVIK